MTIALNPAPPPPTRHLEIEEGDAGTNQTLAIMSDLVDQGKQSPRIISTARRITQQVRNFDQLGIVRAVCSWVKRNIRFRNDPTGIEALATADVTIDHLSGDCDDFAVLICALLESLGIECSLVAAATNPANTEAFTHVWPEALVKGRWFACDLARPGAALGKRPDPRRIFRMQRFTLDGLGAFAGLAGLARYDPGLGRLRRFRLGDDATDGAALVSATGTSIADIVAASNPQSVYIGTSTSGVGPYGIGTSIPGITSATVSGSTVLLLGGVLLLLVLMGSK